MWVCCGFSECEHGREASVGAVEYSAPLVARSRSKLGRKSRAQRGPAGGIVLIRQRFGGEAQPPQQFIVKLRLNRAYCNELAILRLVRVVPGCARIQHV